MGHLTVIVLDLEATCWPPEDERRKRQSQISEPIEIYAAPAHPLVSSSSPVFSEFHSYIRPIDEPQLSSFCTSLTGIQQSVIDHAPSSYEVRAHFEAWFPPKAILATWGTMDQHLLQRWWSQHSDHPVPWTHLDIKAYFERCCRAHRREGTHWFLQSQLTRVSGLSLQEAMRALSIPFVGHQHSAKTDAIAAGYCLEFATSKYGLTPLEQSLVTALDQVNTATQLLAKLAGVATPFTPALLKQVISGLIARGIVLQAKNQSGQLVYSLSLGGSEPVS